MEFTARLNRVLMSSESSSGGESDTNSTSPSAQEGSSGESVHGNAEVSSESAASAEMITSLQSQVAEITSKYSEANDKMYRIAADFENSRKRWEKEKGDLKSYCISEFARDLLPVIDSFDKAMTVIEQLTLNVDTEEGKQVASIVEGVQLVSKVMADTLKKHGVEKLPGKGEPFNPNFHNAIAKTVDATLQQEVVVDEFVSGYRIGERILRTAMVRVASPD
jgi:molecular chaperone GrpE